MPKNIFVKNTRTCSWSPGPLETHRWLLPEHRNFLLLICPIRLLARRRGLAQRAPVVSMGLVRKKSASHLRLQSQMKGFWARWLSKGTNGLSETRVADLYLTRLDSHLRLSQHL